MLINLSKLIKEIDLKDTVSYFLLITFPIILILGNLFINISFFLFIFSFILNFETNKKLINNTVIHLLLLFFISLIINLIFSINPHNSFPRVIKIAMIILFIIEISRLALKYKATFYYNIFKIWFFLYLIIIVDIIFEFIFGFNMLKFYSYMPGRISSFFGTELVVGSFLHGFSLFFLSYLKVNHSRYKFIFYISIFLIILISFIVGERANFVKLLISIMIFTFFLERKNIFKILLLYFFTFAVIVLFLTLNNDYKKRYNNQIKFLFSKDFITNYYQNTQYGAHQIAAFEIFKEYPVFGVGIKNFRVESYKEKYENKENKTSKLRYATHPHQVHLEFLSETGIFGYLIFIYFIFKSCLMGLKRYFDNNNLYLISSLIFITTSLLPIIPSGSFLSTFNSAIFWLNFSIMSSFLLKKTKF